MSAMTPRHTTVVIYQGDDIAQLNDLTDRVTQTEAAVRVAERADKEAGAAKRKPDGAVRLMHQEDPAAAAAAEAAANLAAAREARDAAVAAHDEFAAVAEQRGVTVFMHAQPRRKWRELMGEHGPRDGVAGDIKFSVNMDTLPEVLLPLSIDREKSTIEGDLEVFLESLSDYDYYDQLFLNAFALNRGSAMADPTRRLGSAPSQTSPATSS